MVIEKKIFDLMYLIFYLGGVTLPLTLNSLYVVLIKLLYLRFSVSDKLINAKDFTIYKNVIKTNLAKKKGT